MKPELKFDRAYLKLCKKILNEGIEVENRTGINTLKISGYDLKFNVKEEFPILSTKQLFHRQAITEMLWIWQMESNDVRELQKRNVHIWDEWMVDEDGIYRIYEPEGSYDPDREVTVIDPLSVPVDDPNGLFNDFKPKLDKDGKIIKAKSLIPGKTIKMAKYYGKEYAYTIGTAYGFITNRYKHARNLIQTIRQNPYDRRMVKSLWQDEYLRTAVLPSCVWSTTWNVLDDTLNLKVNQRSCDVPLGLPFNITQYATLLNMIAKDTGLNPGYMTFNISDAHIYVNQIDGIKKQIEREDTFNKLSKCDKKDLLDLKEKLEILLKYLENNTEEYDKYDTYYRMVDMILNPTKPELLLDDVDSFFDYDNSKDLKHVKVKGYKHMGKIKFPIAQ